MTPSLLARESADIRHNIAQERQAVSRAPSLAAVLGPRRIDLAVDNDVVAEHAQEGLCARIAARRILGVHRSAHIPGVTDAGPALAEIDDAGRRPKRIDRTS